MTVRTDTFESALDEATPAEVQRLLLNNATDTTLPPRIRIQGVGVANSLSEAEFSVVKKSVVGTPTSETTSLIDISVSATAKKFVDLPDSLRRSIVPIVKVYKTFTKEERGEQLQVDLRLRTDPNSNGVNRVDLESIDFVRKGGNPAEVDTNIEFNIRLSARELGFYFVKQYPKSEQGRDDEFTRDRESKGVAWIDLIKIDPGREIQVGEPGNRELVLNETDARMKVLIGYASPARKPSGMLEATWQEWKNVITSQQEIFYLNLFKHQFDFKTSGEVGLSIDFIASGNGRTLVPKADIMLGPRYSQRLRDIKKDLQVAVRESQGLPSYDEEAAETDFDYKLCMERLMGARAGIVEGLETQRDHIINLSSRRLLNQLVLSVSDSPTSVSSPAVTRLKQVVVGSENITFETFVREGANISVNQTDNEEGTRLRVRTMQNKVTYDYIYFGDIIEAALEVLAHNGLLGEDKDPNDVTEISEYIYQVENERANQYALPFSHFPALPLLGRASDPRRTHVISEYGGFVLGFVEYEKPEGRKHRHSLLELPISWKLFKEWFDGKTGSKTVWFFRDFLTALVTDFLPNLVFSDEVYGDGSAATDIEKPKFSVVSISVPKNIVDSVIMPETLNTISSDTFIALINASDAPPEAVPDDTNAPPPTVPDIDLSSLLLIRQVRDGGARRSPHAPRLLWGQSTRGILESVSFQREDIPGYGEARIMSDMSAVSNNMMLNEKYNTTLEMIGNTVFLPGCQLYLDPRPLDLGFADERGSYARSLGMGGLYIVNYVEHQMDFIEKSWKTTLDTKWESFGDGVAGDDNDGDEACLTRAERIAEMEAYLERTEALIEEARNITSEDGGFVSGPQPELRTNQGIQNGVVGIFNADGTFTPLEPETPEDS
jgi:hypothetical protein